MFLCVESDYTSFPSVVVVSMYTDLCIFSMLQVSNITSTSILYNGPNDKSNIHPFNFYQTINVYKLNP